MTPAGHRRLHLVATVGGAGEWRVRTGENRIVYEIHDAKLVVLVVAVGHRRDIYNRHR